MYINSASQVCDGEIDCYDLTDECLCENKTICNDVLGDSRERCGVNKLLCYDNRYCDGKPSNIKGCPFGFDETNCTNRFYCTNDSLENISKKRVCNGWIDCSNGEDEAMKRCNSTRFYCLNKGVPLSVGIPRVENGIKECSDGSDECPPNSNRTSLFSNAFEMIGNPFLLAMFWIMGIFAIFGNIVMFIGSVKKFKASTKPLTSCSLWFVINLSIAGFLMGIYLIAIAIKAAEFSKLYCYFDTDWRTSDTCDFLGALVLISCEATAFMMTITTTFRLITILKPFKARSVKPAWSWVATIAAWCFAIILGITPTFNTSSGYFVTAIWFPNHFYAAQSISKSNFEQLACDIITLKSNGTCGGLTWAETKELVTSSFDYLKIKGEFGYFGETSVCLPRLYEKVGHPAWEYTTFLITLNTCLFIYIVACYVILYKQRTKRMHVVRKDGGKGKKSLQQRIFVLVLAHFCCWIPICILAYISQAGANIRNDAYILTAGFLLPINSALNPLLYSNILTNFVK
uniref:G-protein coupled receptors family 1 profile domain-containing protein n=1 Tax=Ciona intestinalis TaxID=7719 RepID=F6PUY5_CIOIN